MDSEARLDGAWLSIDPERSALGLGAWQVDTVNQADLETLETSHRWRAGLHTFLACRLAKLERLVWVGLESWMRQGDHLVDY